MMTPTYNPRIVHGSHVTLDDGRTGRVTFVDRIERHVRIVPTGCTTAQSEWVSMDVIDHVSNGGA